jgi:hypothetical protein
VGIQSQLYTSRLECCAEALSFASAVSIKRMSPQIRPEFICLFSLLARVWRFTDIRELLREHKRDYVRRYSRKLRIDEIISYSVLITYFAEPSSTVGDLAGTWTSEVSEFDSPQDNNLFFCTTTKPALEPTQLPTQLLQGGAISLEVRRQEREADHWLPFCSQVRCSTAASPLSPYDVVRDWLR